MHGLCGCNKSFVVNMNAAYCQVAVDVITEVEHFGSSPAGESQELIKISLQWSNTHVIENKITNAFY